METIDIDSNKIYKYQRFKGIKEFSDKTILPPPLVVFEYAYYVISFAKKYLNGEPNHTADNFRKNKHFIPFLS